MDQHETWHAGGPRSWAHRVRCGPTSPSQRSTTPIFCPYLLCHMAGWIKIPLSTEVALGPGDFVLDGDPKGRGAPFPIFSPCLLWQNGWMDRDGTWHGGGPWCRPLCARWGPSSPPKKGAEPPPPQFSAHFIVAKRLDASRCHLVWR